MRTRYKAQWISKSCRAALRKAGSVKDVLLLDTFEGFIVVEPEGESLGDGPVLGPVECDYELRPAWCAGSLTRLAQAWQRLGLGANFAGTL
jgi:hypothetical protein